MSITDRMNHCHVPGVSIACVEHGEIQWVKGYGLADVETNKLVTPDTLFQAASVSNPVTGFGALRLVQAGKLSLDGDVNDKFVSWRTTVSGFAGYKEGEPLPTLVQIVNGDNQGTTKQSARRKSLARNFNPPAEATQPSSS